MEEQKRGSVKMINEVVNDPEIQNRVKKIEKEIGEALEKLKKEEINKKWSDLELGGNPVPSLPSSFISLGSILRNSRRSEESIR